MKLNEGIIRIKNEEELVEVFKEALHLLVNLRKFTKLWENDHGVELKNRKKYYESRSDDFVERLQVPDHKWANDLKIEINEKDKTIS